MLRLIIRVLGISLVTGALFGGAHIVNAHWEQKRPLYEFCGGLKAIPAEARLDACADQNTIGSGNFRCVASPYKDAHGKVAYGYQVSMLGDTTTTCKVEP